MEMYIVITVAAAAAVAIAVVVPTLMINHAHGRCKMVADRASASIPSICGDGGGGGGHSKTFR
jgi:hypothetical protein